MDEYQEHLYYEWLTSLIGLYVAAGLLGIWLLFRWWLHQDEGNEVTPPRDTIQI